MKRLAFLAALLATQAVGQVRPVASGSDPMQQTVQFAADQTVVLEAAPGFQLTVEFADDEKIRSAAAGDASAWQISAPQNSNHLFVRPSPGAPTTNLTVVTNRHTYYFLLASIEKMTSQNALSVRFVYPQVAAETVKPAVEIPQKSSGNYRVTGASQLRPSLIWDDGQKTYLDWPEDAELPAIFAVDVQGNETLVNGYVRQGKFVIDAVYPRLLFRLDRLMARADRKAPGRS